MGKRYLLWASFRCYRVSKCSSTFGHDAARPETKKKCVVLLLPSSSCPMCTQHVIWDNFEFLAQSAKKCLKTKNILHAEIYAFSSLFSDRKKGVCPWQLIFSRKLHMSAVLLLLYSFFPLTFSGINSFCRLLWILLSACWSTLSSVEVSITVTFSFALNTHSDRLCLLVKKLGHKPKIRSRVPLGPSLDFFQETLEGIDMWGWIQSDMIRILA